MRIAALIASLAALTVVPIAAQAKQPPKPPPIPGASGLAITIAPSPIVYGQTATISGKANGAGAGVSVNLEGQAYPYTGAFTVRRTTTTTNGGSFTFTQTQGTGTRYRAVAKTSPPQTSNVVTLGVRWRVGLSTSTLAPHRGSRVRFSGSVAPAHVGGRVLLQKLTSTGFRSVAQATLRAGTATSSRYTLSVRVYRRGTYRVRVTGDGAHLAGTSRTRTLTVR